MGLDEILECSYNLLPFRSRFNLIPDIFRFSVSSAAPPRRIPFQWRILLDEKLHVKNGEEFSLLTFLFWGSSVVLL